MHLHIDKEKHSLHCRKETNTKLAAISSYSMIAVDAHGVDLLWEGRRWEFSLTTRDQLEAARFRMMRVDLHRALASFSIHCFIKNNCFSLTAGT